MKEKELVERICICGCGKNFTCLSTSVKRYIHGHNMNGICRLDSRKRLLENNPMKNHTIASKQAKLRRKTQELFFILNPERAKAKANKNREASKQMWSNRTKEERKVIGATISTALAKVNWQRANRSRLCYKIEYGNVVFDSGYAVQFAKFCDKNKIEWQYEKIKIRMWDSTKRFKSYTPDFFLPKLGIYVEIKNNYALTVLKVREKLHKAKTLIPLLVLSNIFLSYTRDNTEPSNKGNFVEGVENRDESLRIFNSMVSKLQERARNQNEKLGYLIPSSDVKICSELYSNI